MPDEPPKTSPKALKAIPLAEARRLRGEARVATPRSKVASLRAFRRIRQDRAWGVIGAVLLGVGLVLAFTWPKPPDPIVKKFGVEWPEQLYDLGTRDGNLRITGNAATPQMPPPSSFDFEAPHLNVTSVRVWLAWEDDVARIGSGQSDGDTLELEVIPPPTTNLQPGRARATGGAGVERANITLSFPLSAPPDIPAVTADTEEQARAALGDRSNQTGTGKWTVRVALIRAQGSWADDRLRDDRVPCAQPACTPDTGNAFTLHFEYSAYSVTFKKQF